jgi:hypothetical protein
VVEFNNEDGPGFTEISSAATILSQMTPGKWFNILIRSK